MISGLVRIKPSVTRSFSTKLPLIIQNDHKPELTLQSLMCWGILDFQELFMHNSRASRWLTSNWVLPDSKLRCLPELPRFLTAFLLIPCKAKDDCGRKRVVKLKGASGPEDFSFAELCSGSSLQKHHERMTSCDLQLPLVFTESDCAERCVEQRSGCTGHWNILSGTSARRFAW